jgi:hypothetical protein
MQTVLKIKLPVPAGLARASVWPKIRFPRPGWFCYSAPVIRHSPKRTQNTALIITGRRGEKNFFKVFLAHAQKLKTIVYGPLNGGIWSARLDFANLTQLLESHLLLACDAQSAGSLAYFLELVWR